MLTKKRNIAIIQARINSTRMPGKILREILGKPVLWHLIENLRHSKELTDIVLATSDGKTDDALASFARENNLQCYRGSEEDVLARFYEAAVSVGALDSDTIVRITADDIFMDPYIIDSLILLFNSTYPYYKLVSNSLKPGFPYGFYFELFDVASLKDAHEHARTDFEREHVTPYLREHEDMFPAIAIEPKGVDFSDVYLSIDTPEDFERNRKILEYLESERKKQPYRFSDVVAAYRHLRLRKETI